MSHRGTTALIAALGLLSGGCAGAGREHVSDAAPGRGHAGGAWAAAWEAYLSRAVPFGFAGGVLAVRNGEVVLRGGYGIANRERGAPVTPKTIFYIGSLTKQFTAAGIMTLVDEGRLSVEDPITRFFEAVPEDKQGITLHQLLTHTSGLRANVGELYGEPIGRDEHVRAVLRSELLSAPGNEYRYSNAGYSLLAAIVEIASGTDFEHFLHEHLFRPAGMLETGYTIPTWDRAEIAHGYEGGEDRGTPLDRPNWTAEGPSWAVRGAGGMLSSLDDLYLWHVALNGTDVLSEASKQLLFGAHVQAGEDVYYGYGWLIEDAGGDQRLVWHNGSDGIYYAVVRRWPDMALIAWTNQHLESFHELQANLARSIVSGEVPDVLPPGPVLDVSPSRLASYGGTYRLPSGDAFEILLEADRLVLEPVGQAALAATTGLGPDSTLAAAERNRRAEAFLGAMAAAIRSLPSASSREDMPRLVQRMAEAIRARTGELGPIVGYDVIGTLPGHTDAEPATHARLRFREGSYGVELLWEEGAIGGANLGTANPGRTVLRPRAESEFVGFDFGLEHPVRLRFEVTTVQPPTRLWIRARDGEISATRGAAHPHDLGGR